MIQVGPGVDHRPAPRRGRPGRRDDDPGGAAEAKVLHDLHVVDNGEAAIAFLRQRAALRRRPPP